MYLSAASRPSSISNAGADRGRCNRRRENAEEGPGKLFRPVRSTDICSMENDRNG